jgi:hypothetical protein
VDGSSNQSVPIIQHPDVRRMLMTMRAHTEACRAMAMVAAAACDAARLHPETSVRAEQKAIYEFMVPLVKGYSTEMSVEVASLGIQVHGGMGFIEETGAAQYYRDARILTIYEGTTAIQANDLLGRKTLREKAAVPLKIATYIEVVEQALSELASPQAARLGQHLRAARVCWLDVLAFMQSRGASDPNAVYAGSVPYLMCSAQVVAGWQMARAYLLAQTELDAGLGDRKEQGGNTVPNQTDHCKPGQQAPMVPTHMPEPEGDHGQTGHANAHGCQFERWKGRQNALHKDKRRAPEQG